MTVSCVVLLDDAPYRRERYLFAALPRVGEIVALDWNGSLYPRFIVERVVHTPEGMVDEAEPSFVVLHVRNT